MKGVRLYCDEMLARLGRWLRAAGYDTAIAESGLADTGIIAQCAAEGRILLTRDRHLAEVGTARGVRVLRLSETTVERQARTLRQSLGIDWQHASFTRCLVDNAPLDPAPPRGRLPGAAEFTGRGRPIAHVLVLRPAVLARRPCPAHAGAARVVQHLAGLGASAGCVAQFAARLAPARIPPWVRDRTLGRGGPMTK